MLIDIFSYNIIIANTEAIYVQCRFWEELLNIKQKWQYLGIGKELRFHIWVKYRLVAERLSVRQLIVQCGLKSQLVYIYVRNFRHA